MKLSQQIEYTLLKPDLTYEDIDELVDKTLANNYFGVCVPPFYVEHIRKKVDREDFQIAAVVGFPNGYESYRSKVEEIKEIVNDGANEVDVGLNIGAVKTGTWKYVDSEIDSLSSICRVKNVKLKLITDHNLLTEDEIKRVIELAIHYNVPFIKTASGRFGNTTPEMVRFYKSLCGKEVKIKAAGGITTLEQAEEMVANGADRIGTSTLI